MADLNVDWNRVRHRVGVESRLVRGVVVPFDLLGKCHPGAPETRCGLTVRNNYYSPELCSAPSPKKRPAAGGRQGVAVRH